MNRPGELDPNDFPEIAAAANRAMDAAQAVVPEGFGIALLFTFEYGAGGKLGWVASGDRESMLVMLLEWLERQDPALLMMARRRFERERQERRERGPQG